MEQIILYTIYSLLAVVTFCIMLKLAILFDAGKKNFYGYLKSFFKFYNSFDIINSNSNYQRYMRQNNVINIIYWAAAIFVTAAFWMLHMLEVQNTIVQ
jgi:hypothetical protein